MEDQKKLLLESLILFEREKNKKDVFEDYSFLVFPAAKAYEGFLKKLFLDLGFISQDDYEGNRFRIGRALNPNLDTEYRSESVYDKLADFCNGRALPDRLWETWKNSRNLIFHWFPKHKNFISKKEAWDRINLILDSFDDAFKACKIDRGQNLK